MLEKKKKLTKKEIEEDQLVVAYAKVMEFYKENQTKILSAIGGIAIVVVALVLYTNHMYSQNEEANARLAKVMPLFEAGNFEEAVQGRAGSFDGLAKIVDDLGGTETGQVAKIYLGNAFFNTGKYDEAYESFSDFGGSNEIFIGAAKAGMAACLESKGENLKAAKSYEDAANVTETNPLSAEYFFKAGVNYLKAGDTDQATELLEKVISDYKTSPVYREASRYLEKIKS